MVGLKVVPFKWVFFTIVVTLLQFDMALTQVVKWRYDGACDAKNDPHGAPFRNIGPHGGIAECDPDTDKPCCSAWGFCGLGQNGQWNYCDCPTCTDYRKPNRGSRVSTPTRLSYGTGSAQWRDDERCGSKNDPNGNPLRFLAPNGRVAECDPRSDKPCCSAWGYCGSGMDGNGHQYCNCPTCTDHRRAVKPGDKIIVDQGHEGYYAPRTRMSDKVPKHVNISSHQPPPPQPPHPLMHGGKTLPYKGNPYGDSHHFPNPT
ncbi:unnamed protein product, partial [Meganyctiphanes norvegica]